MLRSSASETSACPSGLLRPVQELFCTNATAMQLSSSCLQGTLNQAKKVLRFNGSFVSKSRAGISPDLPHLPKRALTCIPCMYEPTLSAISLDSVRPTQIKLCDPRRHVCTKELRRPRKLPLELLCYSGPTSDAGGSCRAGQGWRRECPVTRALPRNRRAAAVLKRVSIVIALNALGKPATRQAGIRTVVVHLLTAIP